MQESSKREQKVISMTPGGDEVDATNSFVTPLNPVLDPSSLTLPSYLKAFSGTLSTKDGSVDQEETFAVPSKERLLIRKQDSVSSLSEVLQACEMSEDPLEDFKRRRGCKDTTCALSKVDPTRAKHDNTLLPGNLLVKSQTLNQSQESLPVRFLSKEKIYIENLNSLKETKILKGSSDLLKQDSNILYLVPANLIGKVIVLPPNDSKVSAEESTGGKRTTGKDFEKLKDEVKRMIAHPASQVRKQKTVLSYSCPADLSCTCKENNAKKEKVIESGVVADSANTTNVCQSSVRMNDSPEIKKRRIDVIDMSDLFNIFNHDNTAQPKKEDFIRYAKNYQSIRSYIGWVNEEIKIKISKMKDADAASSSISDKSTDIEPNTVQLVPSDDVAVKETDLMVCTDEELGRSLVDQLAEVTRHQYHEEDQPDSREELQFSNVKNGGNIEGQRSIYSTKDQRSDYTLGQRSFLMAEDQLVSVEGQKSEGAAFHLTSFHRSPDNQVVPKSSISGQHFEATSTSTNDRSTDSTVYIKDSSPIASNDSDSFKKESKLTGTHNSLMSPPWSQTEILCHENMKTNSSTTRNDYTQIIPNSASNVSQYTTDPQSSAVGSTTMESQNPDSYCKLKTPRSVAEWKKYHQELELRIRKDKKMKFTILSARYGSSLIHETGNHTRISKSSIWDLDKLLAPMKAYGIKENLIPSYYNANSCSSSGTQARKTSLKGRQRNYEKNMRNVARQLRSQIPLKFRIMQKRNLLEAARNFILSLEDEIRDLCSKLGIDRTLPLHLMCSESFDFDDDMKRLLLNRIKYRVELKARVAEKGSCRRSRAIKNRRSLKSSALNFSTLEDDQQPTMGVPGTLFSKKSKDCLEICTSEDLIAIYGGLALDSRIDVPLISLQDFTLIDKTLPDTEQVYINPSSAANYLEGLNTHTAETRPYTDHLVIRSRKNSWNLEHDLDLLKLPDTDHFTLGNSHCRDTMSRFNTCRHTSLVSNGQKPCLSIEKPTKAALVNEGIPEEPFDYYPIDLSKDEWYPLSDELQSPLHVHGVHTDTHTLISGGCNTSINCYNLHQTENSKLLDGPRQQNCNLSSQSIYKGSSHVSPETHSDVAVFDHHLLPSSTIRSPPGGNHVREEATLHSSKVCTKINCCFSSLKDCHSDQKTRSPYIGGEFDFDQIPISPLVNALKYSPNGAPYGSSPCNSNDLLALLNITSPTSMLPVCDENLNSHGNNTLDLSKSLPGTNSEQVTMIQQSTGNLSNSQNKSMAPPSQAIPLTATASNIPGVCESFDDEELTPIDSHGHSHHRAEGSVLDLGLTDSNMNRLLSTLNVPLSAPEAFLTSPSRVRDNYALKDCWDSLQGTPTMAQENRSCTPRSPSKSRKRKPGMGASSRSGKKVSAFQLYFGDVKADITWEKPSLNEKEVEKLAKNRWRRLPTDRKKVFWDMLTLLKSNADSEKENVPFVPSRCQPKKSRLSLHEKLIAVDTNKP